ncbi:hypothetical protein BDQ17DRAFT_1381905, partial [Cyathus striatus]
RLAAPWYAPIFVSSPGPPTLLLYLPFLSFLPIFLSWVVPPSGTGGGGMVMAPTLCIDVTASGWLMLSWCG